VKLAVFDFLGREVVKLVDGERGAGSDLVRWNASRFPSGAYVYRLEAHPHSASEAYVNSKQMILVK
jgi:hypothetical protein